MSESNHTFKCVTVHTYTHKNAFPCVTWRIATPWILMMCGITHVMHLNATHRIPMCDMTHCQAWHYKWILCGVTHDMICVCACVCVRVCACVCMWRYTWDDMPWVTMGWLRSVGSMKLQVSFAEYRLFYRALLQKRPIILSILLTKATPWCHTWHASVAFRCDGRISSWNLLRTALDQGT